jgi:hypothetical protein
VPFLLEACDPSSKIFEKMVSGPLRFASRMRAKVFILSCIRATKGDGADVSSADTIPGNYGELGVFLATEKESAPSS